MPTPDAFARLIQVPEVKLHLAVFQKNFNEKFLYAARMALELQPSISKDQSSNM